MPTARSMLSMVAAYGKAYALGGSPGVWTESYVLSTKEEYDIASDTWTERNSMPTARKKFAVAVLGQWVYAIGGNDGGNGIASESAVVEKADILTGIWYVELFAKKSITKNA